MPQGPDAQQISDEDVIEARRDQVAKCFATLDKVIRAVRLYEGQGALVDRLMTDLFALFGKALKDGEMTVGVAPIGLIYGAKPLHPNEDKPARYLFRLFCDGVRELTILPGVEDQEIRALIDVLNSDDTEDDEDLVTLLWKRDLAHIQYFAADTLDMSTQIEVDGEISMAYQTSDARIKQGATGATGSEVRLSKDDLRVLRQDDALEWVRECEAPARATGKVAEAASRVRDAFVVPHDYPRFLEVAMRHGADSDGEASPMVLHMIDAQLRNGALENVAPVLDAIVDAAAKGQAAAIALRTALCNDERMAQLAPIYARNPDTLRPAVQAIARADNNAIVAMLAHLDSEEAEASLQEILNEVEVDLTPFYQQKLQSTDEKEVVDAIQTLGKVGTPAAFKAISQSLGHTLASVRHAALQALQGQYDPESRVAIGRSIRDPNAENRVLAIQLLASSGDNRVAWILLSAIQDVSFNSRSSAEQDLLLDGLASFKDNRTVDFFKNVLSKGGLLGRKTSVDRQVKAARALGQMNTPEAREALEACRSKWGLNRTVKDEIARVLAGGGP